ncbi:Putative NAD(P)H nitroreductase YodC [Limihaloglobus sulfuriphilus]|uniref:Putative NAD(P)H nitroreductase YodC n=1 Tax=Limihaloglobus sulfuriphilus TaxID=1851148 RepID=A0A1Q2MIP3_9BACT|nr:nitroreductase family protein [Limihaloglobus sulfuriphilus]AQQ72534.1 Putative NAD(P)H nitroreductase YodC [Limihaloglobus sulfuriphilus]
MNSFSELVKKCRSYRRFDGSHQVAKQTLIDLVGLARFTASGANLQPLKYIISSDEQKNAVIFDSLAWAGYLTDWDCPAKDERPSGYIIILNDTTIAKISGYDPGIAAQTIMLGAVDRGLGGCMFGSINRKKLSQNLKIPEKYEVLLVLAIGKPVETVVLEDADGDIKYYRDENQVHHVPKRTLDELILDL